MRLLRTTILISILFLPVGCSNVNDAEETEIETYNGIAARLIEEPGSLMSVATDEDGFSLIATREGGTSQQIEDIKNVVAADKDGNTVVINIGDNGLPERAYVDDFVVVFDNYTNTTVDIAMIDPNGEISIVRNIESTLAADLNAGFGKTGANSVGTVMRWVGLTARGVTCGVSAAAAVGSGGLATPVAFAVCGSLVVSVASELGAFEDNEALQQTADFIGWAGGAVGCLTLSINDCYALIIDLSSTALGEAFTEIERLSDEVAVAEGALDTGAGDVQVTLTWDTEADLDLWVTDPLGELIYFGNSSSNSGGQLDRDDVDGFGPENIFWPAEQAPEGQYTVQVDYFSGGQTTNYNVLVQAFGKTRNYTGSILPNQTINVTTFSDTELNSNGKFLPCQTCNSIKNSLSK